MKKLIYNANNKIILPHMPQCPHILTSASPLALFHWATVRSSRSRMTSKNL